MLMIMLFLDLQHHSCNAERYVKSMLYYFKGKSRQQMTPDQGQALA